MYSYNVFKKASEKVFNDTCTKVINSLDCDHEDLLLQDVDGTKIFVIKCNGREIKIYNDYDVDAVYVDSDIELNL